MKESLILFSAIALTSVTVADMNSAILVAKETTAANKVNQVAQATTVLVQGQNPGSGVLIDRQDETYYVLTAKHVVETEDEYEVVTPDGQSYPLQNPKIKRFSDLDLALVSFESDRRYQTAPVGLKPTVEVGDNIFIAGWPASGRAIPHIYQMTTGQVSGISPRSLAGGYQMIYTNVTRQGMSGGPIFNAKAKVIGIHGQAEGREIYLPDADSARLKAGFNLGIPIHQFVKARPSSRPAEPIVIATEPTPTPPILQETTAPPSQSPTPITIPPVSQKPIETIPPLPTIPPTSSLPSVIPSPILLAANPRSNIQFVQPPRLLKATTTEKTTNQLGARYFFTIEVPPNAGASLEQIDFILKLGTNFPRFTAKGAKVFAGKSKRGRNVPVQMVVSDPSSRTVTVTLAEPIQPGQTSTVMLKTVKNPSIGTYQYELRGHAKESQSKGQYIGLGRIEIRPVIKF